MIERFAQMPTALRAAARWRKLGRSEQIPAMLVHPDWDSHEAVPVVVWLHGRTVNKELDPGRYLRWMRAGIGACAIDLPGHGERFDSALQDGSQTLKVVRQAIGEIDEVIESLRELEEFDLDRIAIGGVSAGGMAALARLCQPHPQHAFRCASVEATTGSWEYQRERAMFRGMTPDQINELNPINHLQGWREIPVQAIHAKRDEWVAIEGQAEFIDALQNRYRDPSLIEFIQYDRTGAPHEHMGFGKKAADAKDRQRDFFSRWLLQNQSPLKPTH